MCVRGITLSWDSLHVLRVHGVEVQLAGELVMVSLRVIHDRIGVLII